MPNNNNNNNNNNNLYCPSICGRAGVTENSKAFFFLHEHTGKSNLEGREKSAKKPFARRVELTIYFYVEERRALVMHKKKSKEEERKEKEPDPNFLASI